MVELIDKENEMRRVKIDSEFLQNDKYLGLSVSHSYNALQRKYDDCVSMCKVFLSEL